MISSDRSEDRRIRGKRRNEILEECSHEDGDETQTP